MKLTILTVLLFMALITGNAQNIDYYDQLISSELINASQIKKYDRFRPINKKKALVILYENEKEKLGLSNRRFQVANFNKISANTPNISSLLNNQLALLEKLHQNGLLDSLDTRMFLNNINGYQYPVNLIIFEDILMLFEYKDELSAVTKFISENQKSYESIVRDDFFDVIQGFNNPKEYYNVLKILREVKSIDLADYFGRKDYIGELYRAILKGNKYIDADEINYEIIENKEVAIPNYISYKLISKIEVDSSLIELGSWIRRQEDVNSLSFLGMIGDDFHKVINYALNSMSVNERIYRISFRSKSNRIINYKNIAFAHLSPEQAKLIGRIPGFRVSNESDSNFLKTSTINRFIDSLMSIEFLSMSESVELKKRVKDKYIVDCRKIIKYIPNLTVDGYGEGAFESSAYYDFFVTIANLKNLDVSIAIDTVISSGFNEGVIHLSIDQKKATIIYDGIDDWFDLDVIERMNQLLKEANSTGELYGVNTIDENGSYIFLDKTGLDFFTKKRFFKFY